MKRFQIYTEKSRFYKPFHAVSKRQQRSRIAHQKQALKKAVTVLPSIIESPSIDDNLVTHVNASQESGSTNIIVPDNFTVSNINYFVEERLGLVAQALSNNQCPNLSGSNLRRLQFDNKCDEVTFQRNLAAVLFDASHVLGNHILTVLRTHHCLTYLPKDIRTLLSTPRSPPVLYKIEPGEYLHIGVQTCLVRMLEKVDFLTIPEVLEIDFSTDGAKLYRSGNDIWPIQCKIVDIDISTPEIVGLYKGPKKPHSAKDFFKYVVSDFNEIFNQGGIIYKNKKFSIRLRCFIADAPARAFILGHKNHRSFSPCSKCKVTGFTIGKYMVLKGINHTPRKNEDYIRQTDDEHHICSSPLSELPFNLVTNVIFDSMHMCYLGIMKKLLSTWLRGSYTKNTKLSGVEMKVISTRLKVLSQYCPREFARRIESLDGSDLFKATQWRQMLLYVGVVCFKDVVKDYVYYHFLLFHASMRILVSCVYNSNTNLIFCEMALKQFVLLSEEIYGSTFLSYNIHGILHLIEDVRRFGPCDSYSLFPYENNMKSFRKMCRKPHLSLQQIAARRTEEEYCKQNKLPNDCIKVWKKHEQGPLLSTDIAFETVDQYKFLLTSRMTIGCCLRDNCCILSDSTVCCVQNILRRGNNYYIIVKKFLQIEDFYSIGIGSSLVGIYKCSELSNDYDIVRLENIKSKCYKMPYWTCLSNDEVMQYDLLKDKFVVAVMQ